MTPSCNQLIISRLQGWRFLGFSGAHNDAENGLFFSEKYLQS
jgi:hypothetical protein